MRMPQAQFTVRGLMLAAGLVALAAWAVAMWGRSREYAHKAEQYLWKSYDLRGAVNLTTHTISGLPYVMTELREAELAQARRRVENAERLHRRYRRAAMRP